MTTATRVVCAFCPMLCDGAHTFTHANGHSVAVCEKCAAFITRNRPVTADRFSAREEPTMTKTTLVLTSTDGWIATRCAFCLNRFALEDMTLAPKGTCQGVYDHMCESCASRATGEAASPASPV
jgi:hypothetical protein